MASFLRKLSSRSKSRSNSPVKQCTQNHVADRRTEAIGDGWISSSRPPSPSKHSLTLPPPSPSQNRKTELTAQWNPVKGRFESPKKTPQKSLSKPSGYLSPDGHLLCDGQIPVASTSSYGLHDAHNYSNRNKSPPVQPSSRTYSSLSKHSQKVDKPPLTPISPPVSSNFGADTGLYSTISPFGEQLYPNKTDPIKNRISASNRNLPNKKEVFGEERWRRPDDTWTGGTLLRAAYSNPESAESRIPSKDSSLKSQPIKDDFSELILTPIPELMTRTSHRSLSPKKNLVDKGETDPPRSSRSKSPLKRAVKKPTTTYDFLHPQCELEGCSATIIIDVFVYRKNYMVKDTRFFVCKHQLSRSSDFFRMLFLDNESLPMEGARQLAPNEYLLDLGIQLRHPSQSQQFLWFLECTISSPMLKDLTGENLEACMRLSKQYKAKGLEMRCIKFILENVESKPPIMALCWFNWENSRTFKHRFEKSVREKCLPVVARLPLVQLEKHRQMMPEEVYSDILAMKLRTAYQQSATVFRSIHKMDHFHVDLPSCPRCGRVREQGKVRVQANPCHKLVGCERCMIEFGCEVERKDVGGFQAYYRCEHGLWPFSDRTEDCQCQTPLYHASLAKDQHPPNNGEWEDPRKPASSTTTTTTDTYGRQQQQQQKTNINRAESPQKTSNYATTSNINRYMPQAMNRKSDA